MKLLQFSAIFTTFAYISAIPSNFDKGGKPPTFSDYKGPIYQPEAYNGPIYVSMPVIDDSITINKPGFFLSAGDIISHYITQLNEISIINKDAVKKHIFALLADENTAFSHYMAKICHKNNTKEVKKWANNIKIRINKQKSSEPSAQLKNLSKILKNKINKCTASYTKEHGFEVKPGMDFAKAMKEVFGKFLAQGELINKMKNLIGNDFSENVTKYKDKLNELIDTLFTEDYKKQLGGLTKELQNVVETKSKEGWTKIEGQVKEKVNELLDIFNGLISKNEE